MIHTNSYIKQSSNQASKQASNQASKQASKQASRRFTESVPSLINLVAQDVQNTLNTSVSFVALIALHVYPRIATTQKPLKTYYLMHKSNNTKLFRIVRLPILSPTRLEERPQVDDLLKTLCCCCYYPCYYKLAHLRRFRSDSSLFLLSNISLPISCRNLGKKLMRSSFNSVPFSQVRSLPNELR